MQVLMAAFVATLLNLLVLVALRKRYEPSLYRFVVLCYVGSITLRYIVAIYMWLNYQDAGFNSAFWGDSHMYDTMGAAVAESWSHGTWAKS